MKKNEERKKRVTMNYYHLENSCCVSFLICLVKIDSQRKKRELNMNILL